MPFSVVVLAAGQSTRMKSQLPKVLFSLGGISILEHLLGTLRSLNPDNIVIVHGHKGDLIKEKLAQQSDLLFVEQKEQKGTGHAALQALPALNQAKNVLIINGDLPLIGIKTLQNLINQAASQTLGLVTLESKNPKGLGRIIRKDNKIIKIVEEKDASPDEMLKNEINAGIYFTSQAVLEKFLPRLSCDNKQKEYYLTELITLANQHNIPVVAVQPEAEHEVLGVNDKYELAQAERKFQEQQAKHFMQSGLYIMDPNRFDLRGTLTFGTDVTIDVNVVLEGSLELGNNVYIGPNVYIKNAVIKDNSVILANTVIDGAFIGPHCNIGPFARIRPETHLHSDVKVGNFVEMKATQVQTGSKINHHSYIGDTNIGKNVNIGAGTITCNFDGKNKHKTNIGDNVFIGSDCQLIAPVSVGNNVTIGAGTTVVKDVAANQLIHNQITHRVVNNWKAEDE